MHHSAPQLSTADPELPTLGGPFVAKSLLTNGQTRPDVFELKGQLWLYTHRPLVFLENVHCMAFFVKTVSHWRLLKFSSHPLALSFQAYGPIFEPRVRVQELLAVKSTLFERSWRQWTTIHKRKKKGKA